MDFLDPKKKRAQRIRLNIGYGLMAVLLALTTAIVLLITYGYSLDRRTGAIIQNGLVFVSAHPDGARVTLNGVEKDRTDARYALPAGQYQIKLTQPGYRSWEHTLELEGGKIERLTYPVLFPEKLISVDRTVYNEAPGFASQSPDKRWLMVQPAVASPDIQLHDLNASPSVTSTIQLPPGMVTSAGGTWQLVEWSSDSRHALLRYALAGKVEYILVDRQTPASSLNLSTSFNRPTASFYLKDKRVNELYIFGSDQSLSQANLTSKVITPLLSHVLTFQSEGSNFIMYVTSDGAKPGQVLVRILDKTTNYILREIPAADRYHLSVKHYSGRQFVVVGDVTQNRAYLYRNPLDELNKDPNTLPTAFGLLRVTNMSGLSSSPSGRFISLQGGGQFAVYDAEENRQPRFDTKLPLADPKQLATWMDDNHLTLISNGKLVVFDFDGTNVQTLVAAYPTFTPFFNRDYQALYTLGVSLSQPEKNALVRTDLKVASQQQRNH